MNEQTKEIFEELDKKRKESKDIYTTIYQECETLREWLEIYVSLAEEEKYNV